MKYLLALLFTVSAFASDCDVAPLRKEVVDHYSKLSIRTTDENGKFMGNATFHNIKTSEQVLLAKYESFLVVTADVWIGWKKSVPMTVLWNVDTASCTLETFNSGDTFGSSLK